MSRQRNRISLIVLFLGLMAVPPFAAFSAEKTPEGRPNSSDFSYNSQDRRDPFESVYEAKTRKTVPDSKQKEGYELEELKLVGVVKTGDVKFVMMEDVQGRGLLFKKGDFINSSVWLLDILEDKVILAHKLRGDIRKIAMDIPRK
jgi:Tfp pilus assembly protein PilP